MNFDRFSQTKKENAIVYGNERPQVAQNREIVAVQSQNQKVKTSLPPVRLN